MLRNDENPRYEIFGLSVMETISGNATMTVCCERDQCSGFVKTQTTEAEAGGSGGQLF